VCINNWGEGGGRGEKFSLYILYIVNINIYDENIKNIYFFYLYLSCRQREGGGGGKFCSFLIQHRTSSWFRAVENV